MADQWAEPLFPCNSSKLSFAKPGFMKSFMKMMNSWENIRIGKTASKSAGKCKGVVASRLGQPNYFPNKLRMKKQQQNLMKKNRISWKTLIFRKWCGRSLYSAGVWWESERFCTGWGVLRLHSSPNLEQNTFWWNSKKYVFFIKISNFHECHFFSNELGGGVEKRRRPEKRVLEGKNSKNTRFRENGRVNK